MTTDQLDSYHERLLTELRAVVTEVGGVPGHDRAGHRFGRGVPRRRLTGLGVAAAAAAAAAVLVTVQSGPAAPPAYAVTGSPGGDVEVIVHRAEDAAGLQQALADKGIRADITYVPWGRTCAEGRYTQADAAGRPGVVAIGSDEASWSVTIPAHYLEPGETWVLALAARPDARAFMAQVGIASGPVEPCRQVPAPPLPDPS